MKAQMGELSPRGGIVRSAKRPAGWRAPGPRPPAAPSSLELWPGPREDLCWLAGDWRILQRVDGHRWSLDDLATAHLPAELSDAPERVLDLGCGIGTVALFLAWCLPCAEVVGIEAQGLSAAMARRSIAWNGVEARVRVL